MIGVIDFGSHQDLMARSPSDCHRWGSVIRGLFKPDGWGNSPTKWWLMVVQFVKGMNPENAQQKSSGLWILLVSCPR